MASPPLRVCGGWSAWWAAGGCQGIIRGGVSLGVRHGAAASVRHVHRRHLWRREPWHCTTTSSSCARSGRRRRQWPLPRHNQHVYDHARVQYHLRASLSTSHAATADTATATRGRREETRREEKREWTGTATGTGACSRNFLGDSTWGVQQTDARQALVFSSPSNRAAWERQAGASARGGQCEAGMTGEIGDASSSAASPSTASARLFADVCCEAQTIPLPKAPVQLQDMRQRVTGVFLPEGFPHSVRAGFAGYCGWQFLQIVCGTAGSVLSTQAMLFALGLGSGAVPLAAAINWVLKDGLGQFGGMLYAAIVGTRFDEDPKRHRLLSTVLMQASCFLEVLTPLVPHLFLPLASISNFGKNVSFLAAGATRAQFRLSFLRNANLGDATAKITSQSILASLIGTAAGIAVSSQTGADPMTVLVAFAPLAAVSVFSTYKSCQMVPLQSLNVQRCELILQAVLPDMVAEWRRSGTVSQSLQTRVTPEMLASKERFVWKRPRVLGVDVDLQPPLHRALQQYGKEFMARVFFPLVQRFNHPAYLLGITPEAKQQVALWYTSHATPSDMLKGFVHATAVRLVLEEQRCSGRDVNQDVGGTEQELEAALQPFANVAHEPLTRALHDWGWQPDNVQFVHGSFVCTTMHHDPRGT
eukprot:m.163046 g.163046  ORF g.163046 m.163046 type:complete len:646 (+) comp17679_c2_seq5:190-2127(+)